MSKRWLAVAALAAFACGGGGGDDVPPSPDGAPYEPERHQFEVTYAANAHEISEADGLAHLTGDAPNADTLTYTFDSGATAIAALVPGDIAVLAGIAYRKVVSVTDDGAGTLTLVTERTTLPEAITEGTIAWAQTVDFADLAALRSVPVTMGDQVIGDLADAIARRSPISYSGMVDGYNVSLTLTPSAGRVDIDAVARLEVAGEDRFALHGTGHLEGFQTRGAAVIGADGISFEAGNNHIRGELSVQAAAFNTGLSDELLDVPLGFDIPIQVGPVPLILKIKANINVRLILSIADSSAEATVTFAFSSDQGITASGSSLNATGALQTGTLGEFAGGSVDGAAAGMSVCIEFPRFELTMLGEFASVGITQNNCAATSYQFQPACNEVTGSIVGIALANLGFFGITLAEGQVELYRRADGRQAGEECPPLDSE